MVTLSVTGHMNLTEGTVPLVAEALRRVVAGHAGAGLTGVSCLARGADTLFAEEIVAAGGSLQVVLPSRDYRERKVKPGHAADFDRLLARAEVETLPFATADKDAYAAANEVLLDRADVLVAVWDGVTAGNRSGTAEVVALARGRGVAVEVVWPAGAARG